MEDQSQPTGTPPLVPSDSATQIHITVRDRRKVIYQADARAVTTYNDTGLFDVLPQHSNFISLIQKELVVHTIDGKKTTITIDNGILKVKSNAIYCYVNLLGKK